jgi:hypothetical protein
MVWLLYLNISQFIGLVRLELTVFEGRIVDVVSGLRYPSA